MSNVKEKIKKFLLSFTSQKQREKELEKFIENKNKLEEMCWDELNLQYFKRKAEYEHKKMILPIFLVSILISIVMNVWKYFYTFIERILKYSSSQLGKNSIEEAQVIMIIFSIVVVFITICIFIFIINYLKRIRMLSKELLLIEEVRKNRER